MQIAIKKNKVTGLTLAVCLFAAIFLGIIFLPDLPFQSWDFQSNLWGPAYLLVHGWSPYDIHHIIPDTNAVWLPMVVGLFAPLGLLSQAAAEKFWFLLTIAALFLIIWLSCNQKLLQTTPIYIGSRSCISFSTHSPAHKLRSIFCAGNGSFFDGCHGSPPCYLERVFIGTGNFKATIGPVIHSWNFSLRIPCAREGECPGLIWKQRGWICYTFPAIVFGSA